MMCEVVLVAGTDTTRNQLACAMALFAQHPDQWALLAERPELAEPGRRGDDAPARAPCEARPASPRRTSSTAGVVFPAGTLVTTSFVGSNTDPTVFGDPMRFDITREGCLAAAHVRQRHPLLPRGVAGPGRAAGGPRDPGQAHARPRPRRPDRVEAEHHRHLGTGPPAAALRPDLTELPATWRRAGCRRSAARPR